ncbi:hypothetical protein CBM2609_B10017 [Cupriavidus taiwanensis]|uniref:Uncharacterized protein n=1 Tax=Cupriavidus taiwanensis TaxID=164546 RepID=A0A976AZQ6_9BURK|nr:hypothetical protein CBM2604_B10015 [Cupriavidus taiwanensis]SOZ29645.1 hypothetical protein CBM2609_B10017 [Cupriavidus taiwanensis]SOZ46862.1 hypothetical protein CBM2610_B10015 [Cupriavidus taiwanensis]SOZ62138.1 hypothetical protein CBM2615_B10242 [Cupriavidus taiwanensis]SOZ62329.1 hypothetical protein CBM2614_B10149 [Cupriavidus taiwanensis]
MYSLSRLREREQTGSGSNAAGGRRPYFNNPNTASAPASDDAGF